MAIRVRCPCLNITLHLLSQPDGLEPAAAASAAAFASLHGATISRFARATLSVGGVAAECDGLMDIRAAPSPDAWELLRCANCSADLCLRKASVVLINCGLPPPPSNSPLHHFSAPFRIYIENKPDVADSLLESPEAYDTGAVAALQALQRRVERAVAAEEAAVEDRIVEFERKERAALRDFQLHAYRDRKIVWHHMCSVLRRRHAPPPPPSSTPPSATPSSDASSAGSSSTSSLQSTTSSSSTTTLQPVPPPPGEPDLPAAVVVSSMPLAPTAPHSSLSAPPLPTSSALHVFDLDEEVSAPRQGLDKGEVENEKEEESSSPPKVVLRPRADITRLEAPPPPSLLPSVSSRPSKTSTSPPFSSSLPQKIASKDAKVL